MKRPLDEYPPENTTPKKTQRTQKRYLQRYLPLNPRYLALNPQ